MLLQGFSSSFGRLYATLAEEAHIPSPESMKIMQALACIHIALVAKGAVWP